jgi:3-oxoacyl-(acyl-carrier-protein) synthase
MSPLTPVAITGLGVIGATGRGFAAMDEALRAGREGVGELSLWESSLAEFPVGQYRGNLAGDLVELLGDAAPAQVRMSRSDMLALAASAEALQQAGLDRAALATLRAGAHVGQSVCGTLTSEQLYIETWHRAKAGEHTRSSSRGIFVHEGATTLDLMARVFSLSGPTLTYMTACSSAANAIGLAADTIRSGRADVMLAGGADSLSRIAFNGFCALKVVSPDGPRPFDRDRQGMMVGEGAGMLVLESLDHARKRGAKVLATVSGYGHSCDAHHLTAPHPEGKGANAAMREALAQAGLDAADVGYINAHGTATQDNDRTEARAIHQVFGADVPVSSTKRFFGHTLAAAGGVEAVVSAWALMNQVLPANLGLREPLEDGPINLVGATTPAQRLKHELSNSFGFGGNNAALVFSKAEE